MERFMEEMMSAMQRPGVSAQNWLKMYRDMRPPSFKGDPDADPSVGEYWLEQTEKLLEHMDCPRE